MPVYLLLRKVGEDDLVAALAMSSRYLREARLTATSVNATFVDGRETFSKEGVQRRQTGADDAKPHFNQPALVSTGTRQVSCSRTST